MSPSLRTNLRRGDVCTQALAITVIQNLVLGFLRIASMATKRHRTCSQSKTAHGRRLQLRSYFITCFNAMIQGCELRILKVQPKLHSLVA